MRLARTTGRVLLGTAGILALLALVLFAVGTYLVSIPLQRQSKKLARARVTVDLLSAAAILWQLRDPPPAAPEPAPAEDHTGAYTGG